MHIGYSLSSEEHAPSSLVRFAVRAEEAGFEFALISDHFHPWVPQQGQSGFVWGTLGAIAQATRTLRVGTGVTCPILRIHPAIIAQAAATAAELFDGRFFLGVGAGENLNEHILGDRWPRPAERQDWLEEAIGIIRALWTGEELSLEGQYYLVDEARLYTLPRQQPDLYVAASGPDGAELARRMGDGLISTSPDRELIETFRTGGERKPTYAQVTVCWAETEQEARQTIARWWPTAAVPGSLSWEVKTPEMFAEMCKGFTEDQMVEHIAHGPDPGRWLESIRQYREAGFDHIYLHQIGPDQEGFFRFFERQIRERL